ncbi:hypothetical protein Aduo_015427 [Ancylostoma duodenale]
MPLKIADEHTVDDSDNPYGRTQARQNRQKEWSDMMIFFIPLGVVLFTSLVLEIVAIFYSRRIATRERAAEAAAARKQDTVTEGTNSEDLERSAIGVDSEDSFFKA